MLTHIVLFRLKDRRHDPIVATRDRIARIEGRIPALRSIQVGVNIVVSDHACDIALVTTFDSMDDLHAFQAHPVHLELLREVMPRYEAFWTVDFET
jgi:hypothetical protein